LIGGEIMQVELSEKYVKAEDIDGTKDVKFNIIEEPLEVIGQYGKKIECRILMKKGNEKAKAKWSLNNTNKDLLITHIGAETTEWIGKDLAVHVETINGKKSILLDKEQF